jgi:predicted RNA-binding protein associated with RNAse of E/G family
MTITVIKRNEAGQESWRYTGKVLSKTENAIVLEAHFNHDDLHFHGMWLKKGDRFVETYYNDRWYNIFEVYDRDDGCIKGWYCNVGTPASISEQIISYRDLALDLLVFPDGRQVVLDEDEFEALSLSPCERIQALKALQELQRLFQWNRNTPNSL